MSKPKQKMKPVNRAAVQREVLSVRRENETDRKRVETAPKAVYHRGARVR